LYNGEEDEGEDAQGEKRGDECDCDPGFIMTGEFVVLLLDAVAGVGRWMLDWGVKGRSVR